MNVFVVGEALRRACLAAHIDALAEVSMTPSKVEIFGSPFLLSAL
jgi:hypothetical protein